MAKNKIALFGGTFDPVHTGHTAVASAAARYIAAQKVIFVPARRSILKTAPPGAGDNDRSAMIALAIEGNKTFELSDYELKKNGRCYTLETVRHFKDRYGDDVVLCWLMGADSIGDFHRWYRVTELISECEVCTMYRAGFEKPDFSRFEAVWGDEMVRKLQDNVVPTPLLDVSSTEIRRRLAAGENVDDMLHPAVRRYIRDHGLYRR